MSEYKHLTRLEKDLLRDEGLRLLPYEDSVGKLTIGIGRNLDDNGVSEAEAFAMLRNDIATAKAELSRFGWYNRLDEQRQDAITNMCFNVGLPTLLKFKRMIAALDYGDYISAADEALDSRWADQVGERSVRIAKILRG